MNGALLSFCHEYMKDEFYDVKLILQRKTWGVYIRFLIQYEDQIREGADPSVCGKFYISTPFDSMIYTYFLVPVSNALFM